MAAQLEKAKRRENLHEYHKKGPVAFFQDYDMLTKTLPSQKKSLRFRREFRQMLARWERDATKSEASGIGLIPIPFDADLAKLQNSLRDAFSASSLYPDVHKDLMRVAQYHLKKENPQQALSLLRLAHEWYPRRIRPMTSLASLYLWIGNAPYAKQYFRMAFEKDPAHPDLSIDRFQALARDLISADKKNSLVDLAAIATDLYPRSPGIFKGLGDMFENLGMKDAALLYYKKALKVNRKLEDVRKKIKALEKERKK
jgi:tetratricopeptide (TPR) repeat protein